MTAAKRNYPITALAVGEFEQDRALLRRIFNELGWRLYEAPDRTRAMGCLERHRVEVVIAESNLPNWQWQKVLEDLRRLDAPPQLIVTSRTADDHLWSEVLNVGGFDVLPQPLERDEAERVIAAARRHAIPPGRAVAVASAASRVA